MSVSGVQPVNTTQQMMDRSLKGAAVGTVMAVVEHPSEALRIHLQSKTKVVSILEQIRMNFRTLGNSWVYQGFSATCIVKAGKGSYRAPVYFGVTDKLTQILGPNHAVLNGVGTALALSTVDASLLTMFERYRLFLVLNETKEKNCDFSQLTKNLPRSMYMTGVKSFMSWGAWDVSSKFAREVFKEKSGETNIGILGNLGISIGVGTTVGTLLTPLRVLKTHVQLPGSSGTITGLASHLYKLGGWRLFLVGAPIEIGHISLFDFMMSLLRESKSEKSY